MAKDFKGKSPMNNFTLSQPITKPVTVESSEVKKEPEFKIFTPPVKKKVGRPKTKDVKGTCKTINVAVPITLLDKWEDVKIIHGSNLTEYVTKLIERDMDSSYEKYKRLADSLKDI